MDLSTTRRPRLVILTSDKRADPYNLEEIRALADVVLTDADGLPDAIAEADALLLWDFFSRALPDAWPRASRLRWLHVSSAGVDHVLFEELVSSGLPITNAHGFFDQPIAEFVLASVLAHVKDLHGSKALQRARIWRHRETGRAAGQRALVIGTGGIGRATARLLRAAGLEVTGAGRRARQDDPDFGTVVDSARLTEHVAGMDHVVMAAPLTPQTRGLIGAEVLAAMEPHAHLVNIGRGAHVDEEALIEALRSGQIAAASLDVFATEPLPPESPLWDLDNAHVSAHMSGDVRGWQDGLADIFLDNLRRFTSGAPLRNLVDPERGYVPRSS